MDWPLALSSLLSLLVLLYFWLGKNLASVSVSKKVELKIIGYISETISLISLSILFVGPQGMEASVLFDLILYVPSTIFQLYRGESSWVEPVLSWDKCVLLKDHNAVTPVRLKLPAALRSRGWKHLSEILRVLQNRITPFQTNGIFPKAAYNKDRVAHCIYCGVTGYNFQKKRLILS